MGSPSIVCTFFFILSLGGIASSIPAFAIVGSSDYDGLVYSTKEGPLVIKDNFGFDKSTQWPAVASCNGGLLYTSGGNQIQSEMQSSKHMAMYDPKSGKTVTYENVMAKSRVAHSMTCVNNDQDLILCGNGADGQDATSCEVCHLSSGSPICISIASMPGPNWFHAAVASHDKLFVLGGDAGRVAWELDIKLSTWKTLPQMSTSREAYPGVVIVDNSLLVCGGSNKLEVDSKTCETIDITKMDAWIQSDTMNIGHSLFALVKQGFNNVVYALGGFEIPQVETWSMKSGTWSFAANYNFTDGELLPYTASPIDFPL